MPFARVLVFQYDVKVWMQCKVDPIRDIARDLLKLLEKSRSGLPATSTIWVSHSLGGMIVKEVSLGVTLGTFLPLFPANWTPACPCAGVSDGKRRSWLCCGRTQLQGTHVAVCISRHSSQSHVNSRMGSHLHQHTRSGPGVLGSGQSWSASRTPQQLRTKPAARSLREGDDDNFL